MEPAHGEATRCALAEIARWAEVAMAANLTAAEGSRHHDHHPRAAVALLDRLVHLRNLVERELPHRQVLDLAGALPALEVRDRPHIGLCRQLVHVDELDGRLVLDTPTRHNGALRSAGTVDDRGAVLAQHL